MSGLHKKIVEIMKEVTYIQKNTKVSYNNTSYLALTEEKVTTLIRKQFIDKNLTFYPIKQEYSLHNDVTTLNITYRLTDADTGESIEVSSTGQGKDRQDKGAGKASTYAYKYALLRLFAIPTGDDPDQIHSSEWDESDMKEKEQLINYIISGFNTAVASGANPNLINEHIFSVVGGHFKDLNDLDLSVLRNISNIFK